MKKKLSIAVVMLALISCSSNKVQILNSFLVKTPMAGEPSLNGSLYQTLIMFYDDRDRLLKTIDVGTIDPKGKSEEYPAAPKATYFKVEWRVHNKDSEFGNVKFTSKEYTPIIDGLSVCEIHDKTPATINMPPSLEEELRPYVL